MTAAVRNGVLLEARRLAFSYAKPAVRDFSMEAPAGAVTGIIGPNGCGKTTVLRLLDGILHPACGEVLLRGRGPITALSRREVARHIAMVPQNGHASEFHTVFQFAVQGRSPHLSSFGFENSRDEEIACEALEMTRLGDRLDTPVSELSGGERQRLLLARALAQEPEILLLDEFTANLDINYQVELMRLVRRLTMERGLATVIVSHEIHLLANFSDGIVLMKDGTVCHRGRVPEVVTRENLKRLFGLDFLVRPLPSGIPEVLPKMDDVSQ